METVRVAACPQCQVFWFADGEPARCVHDDHEHHQLRVHRHRSRVVLPDGSTITAVSFDPADPYGRDEQPDFGLYLDDRWQPPWRHEHFAWPDFGVPGDPQALVLALQALLERARAGQCVEVGCLGGHGRTGTALACLAVLCGHPPDDAVAWVRERYCADAVETEPQRAFVLACPSPSM